MAVLSLLSCETPEVMSKSCLELLLLSWLHISRSQEMGQDVNKAKIPTVAVICAHSYQPCHASFEIEMPRDWIVTIVPWLKLYISRYWNSLPNLETYPSRFHFPHWTSPVKWWIPFLDSVTEQGTIVWDIIVACWWSRVRFRFERLNHTLLRRWISHRGYESKHDMTS